MDDIFKSLFDAPEDDQNIDLDAFKRNLSLALRMRRICFNQTVNGDLNLHEGDSTSKTEPKPWEVSNLED